MNSSEQSKEYQKEQEQDLFGVIHNRRSIRKFTDQAVPNFVLEKILKTGIRAPFAAQLYSIVYTRDKEKMKQLKKMGVYPTTQILMVFLIDCRKIEKIILQRGYEYDYDDSMLLWLAIQDASLVAENVILAADALGLGSVLLGGAPLIADQIAKVFKLPSRVFPVVGLCLGYPDLEHLMETRPRFPLKFIAFEEFYTELSECDVQECMEAMDEGYITQGYYIKQKAKIPLKEGKDTIDYDTYSWSEHISRKFCQGFWSDESLLTKLKKHGFNLE